MKSNILRKLLWTSACLVLVCGCSSIHSKAVRKLIQEEAKKIVHANEAATNFIGSANERAGKMKVSVADLNNGMTVENTSDMTHALLFSSNQNVDTKSNVDAYAVAYLVGKLYLTQQAGLQQEVNDQFKADIDAIQKQAQQIQQSWSGIKVLHAKVQAFANKSAFASIDADFLAALAGEIPGASAEVETVLKDSEKLNDALKTATKFGPLNGTALQQSQGQLTEFIDLLDRVKSASKQTTTNQPAADK